MVFGIQASTSKQFHFIYDVIIQQSKGIIRLAGMGNKLMEKTINVATLNYSGILKSPYQFYEEGTNGLDKAEIGHYFYQMTIQSNLEWEFGRLDTTWQEGRYSPLYQAACGINNSFMMNRSEFERQWKRFQAKYQGSLMKSLKKLQQKHFINMMRFDTLIYKAILMFVHKQDPEQTKIILTYFDEEIDRDKKLKNFRIEMKKYRSHQKKMFTKKFLNEDYKISMVKEYLLRKKIDVFFLQEVTLELIARFQSKMPQYKIVKALKNCNPKNLSSTSIIFIKDETFGIRSLREQNMIFHNNIEQINENNLTRKNLTPEEIKSLNINNDTTIQAIGNLFLISCHLTSKTEKKKEGDRTNEEQLIELSNLLKKLRVWFPHCDFILGGDLNGNYLKALEKQAGIFPDYNIYPQDLMTTNKTRTILQVQKHKAQLNSNGIKDYIISSLEILEAEVMDIKMTKMEEKVSQKKNNKALSMQTFFNLDNRFFMQKARQICASTLLPTDRHPFDHFVVFSRIKLNKPIMRINSLEYHKRFKPEDLTEEDIAAIDKQWQQSH